MRIKQYRVTLRRIEKRDIELIRKYRNSDEIRKNMIYQEYISKEMQLEWFKSIEKDINKSYYIIVYKRKKVGLVNINNYNNDVTEAGLFMFKKEFTNSFIPTLASIILFNATFNVLQEGNGKNIIRVLKRNKPAIKFNKSLGYKIIDDNNLDFYTLEITKDSFNSSTLKIKKAIKNIYGQSNFEFILEPIDFKLGLTEFFDKYEILNEPNLVKKIIKKNYKRFVLKID